MKAKIIYTLLLSITISCNSKIDEKENINTVVHEESKKTNDNKMFSNRAEELIAIREYLKEKLPNIIIDRFPAQIEKLQFSLIADGYNISLEETAKKSLHYKNQYQRYMSIFMTENFTYDDVVVALSDYKKFQEKRIEKSYDVINLDENLSTKADTIVKQIKIHLKPEVELISESVENNDYSNKSNGITIGSGSGSGREKGKYILAGRQVVYAPQVENDCNNAGRVIIEVTVDKSGNTISARNGKGSTADVCLIALGRRYALETKWQPSESAPEKQIGIITYNFSF